MKHLHIICLAVLTTLSGTAQIENFLGPPMQLNGIYSGSNVSPVLIDMDGDGDLDVIRSAWDSPDLVWHRNEGNGLWSQEIVLMSNLPNLHRVEAHDFNNDGLLDLGLLTYYEHRLYAAMSTGVGQFSAPNPITGSFSEAIDFAAGDFDGDGDVDMVEIDRGYGEVVLYTYEESGFNPNPMMMGQLTGPTFGEAADVDGDGRDEILISPNDGVDRGIWLFDWEEDAGWTYERLLYANGIDQIIAVDFDGDEDLDILIDNSQQIRFLEQTDSAWVSNLLIANSNHIHDFELLGSPENWQIYVNSQDSDNIKRYELNEDNEWEFEVVLDIINCRDFHWMEDDSGLAMVTRQAFGGQVAVRRNLEDLSVEELVNNNNINTPWYTKWAQLDTDLELEIVVASSETNQIYWFDYNGNENWGSPKLLSNLVINPYYVDLADVDGDGDDDILVVGRSENRIAWIENLGDGQFSALNTVTVVLDDPEMAKWVDIEGDGDLDVVATSNADRRFVYFENDGSNSFGSAVDLVSPHPNHGPVEFDAEDIDGDGIQEFLITYYYEAGWVDLDESLDPQYHVLGTNQSSGENRVSKVHGASWGHIDDNSNWDAIVASYEWSALTVYRGTNSGFMPGEWLYNRNPYRFDPVDKNLSLTVEDLDNDGLDELVHNERTQEHLSIVNFNDIGEAREIFQTGIGFEFENTNAEANFRNSDWKDWDGDGDPDLVTSHPWNDWIYVQENKQELLGCTNPEACNFDPAAEFDDGKCMVVGETCNDAVAATYNDVIQADCTCGGTSFNGEIAHRINSGYTAGDWVDQEGNVWSPEAYVVGGGNTSTGLGVNETADDSLYRWVRYNLIGYDLPVEAGGTYLVRLHFACIRGEVNQEGFQVFDIELEGQTVYDNLDLFAVNGGERYKRFIVEEIVSTEDEILQIRFPAEVWQNEVSAVEVFAYTGDCMDIDADGVCDDLEVNGCTYPLACNYDPEATENDGSCDFVTCAGCMDETACNFDPEATFADASCTFPEPEYDCDGNCLSDIDGDEVCDAFEVNGCTYVTATNYDPAATNDDGTCVFDGISEILGCTYPGACNYDANAILDDGSCTFAPIGYTCEGDCIADSDGDGVCDEYEGCTIEEACNYNPMAQDNSGCCIFAQPGEDCDGNCLADTDGDGVCDANELAGCTDPLACNYSPLATDESGFCIYPPDGADCAGNCESDTDGDGVCDAAEIPGCMDSTACNYNEDATDADGSCTYPEAYVDCDGNCLADFDGDGVCDANEITGCIYPEAANFNLDATEDDGSCVFDEGAGTPGCFYSAACNFNPEATTDDGSCAFPEDGYDCEGVCLNDCDGDGICDDFEIPGCTDESACNFNPEATEAVDNCEFLSCAGCMDNTACNYDAEATIDAQATCEFTSCAGCMDAGACNFDPAATIADTSCEFLSCAGCTYPIASNYDPEATIDDGSCEFLTSELCNGCMGDLNNNLQVDTGDLLLLLTVFATDCPPPSDN